MEQTLARISGKTELAAAIRYALARWEALTLVLRDGRACLDNNAAERAMRPMTLGRKNWLPRVKPGAMVRRFRCWRESGLRRSCTR